jgi:hypothetical protein
MVNSNLIMVAMITVAAVPRASSFSYQQQVKYNLPTNYFDGTCRKMPRPPPYPPQEFDYGNLLFDHVDQKKSRSPPLPMTNNPYALLGLDWLNPPNDFAVIHRAYKSMAKIYHPDLALGPDCTPEERHQANIDFARINAAYEQLKAKEAEEVLEYIIYIDGKKVRRHVTINSESYYNDPTRPNYDRIIAMTKYREKYPRKKLWFERKHDYEPRHNGEWEP